MGDGTGAVDKERDTQVLGKDGKQQGKAAAVDRNQQTRQRVIAGDDGAGRELPIAHTQGQHHGTGKRARLDRNEN